MLTLLAPWTVRNYFISGEFVPITTHGAIAFFYGDKIIESYSLWSNTAGDYPNEESGRIYNNIRDSIRSRQPSLSPAQVEVRVDRELAHRAVIQVLSDPLRFINKVLFGVVFVWFLGDTGLKSTALLLLQGPLVLLALIGIFYAVRAKKQVLPLLILLMYFVLIQTAFLSLGRFSHPVVPLLIMFAAYALEVFCMRFGHIFQEPVA